MRIAMAILFLLIGLFVLSTCEADEIFFPVYTDAQPGLIVSEKYALDHKADFNDSLGKNGQTLYFWTPTLQDIAEAQQALRKSIDQGCTDPSQIFAQLAPKGGYSADEVQRQGVEITFIREHYDRYARQYVGIIMDGKKLVFCNFVDTEYSDSKAVDPTKEYVFVQKAFAKDMHFLQAQYDPEAKKVLNVALTGYWTAAVGAFIKVPTNDFVGYIIPKEYAEQNLSYLLGKEEAGFWQPSFDDVNMAYKAVGKVLKGPKETLASIYPHYLNETAGDRARRIQDSEKFHEIPSILAAYGKYHLQFVGIMVKGKKHILCNFVLWQGDDHGLSIYYNPGVPDSGTSSWRIDYDVESGICSNFDTCGWG
ncbi:MAG: hypothetical protein LV481_12010 [Methylacidiphilales bacterium]|nr:hypothetical protein [Candidatus Methylacidiphilales bacterium]